MIQMHEMSSQQLIHLAGIHTNTENLSRLEAIEENIRLVKDSVTDLNDIGIRIIA